MFVLLACLLYRLILIKYIAPDEGVVATVCWSVVPSQTEFIDDRHFRLGPGLEMSATSVTCARYNLDSLLFLNHRSYLCRVALGYIFLPWPVLFGIFCLFSQVPNFCYRCYSSQDVILLKEAPYDRPPGICRSGLIHCSLSPTWHAFIIGGRDLELKGAVLGTCYTPNLGTKC
jgi:hypothetical protein